MLNDLPAQVSSFIGRDAELAEVRHLVSGSRLAIPPSCPPFQARHLDLHAEEPVAVLLASIHDKVITAVLSPGDKHRAKA